MPASAATIALIAQSEFTRRVRTKMFVFTTLLAPALMLVATLLPVAVVALTSHDAERRVGVVDASGRLAAGLAAALPEGYVLDPTPAPADTLRARVLRGALDGYFHIPADAVEGGGGATFFSRGGGGLSQQAVLRGALREAIRAERLRAAGAPPAVLDALETRTPLALVTVTAEGDAADGALASSVVGYVMGLLIYVAVLIYGIMVMRGVIEEKAGRIVEVIASSVRPFELMMGKVLGIGAMGLVQLAAWGVLLVGMAAAAGPVLLLLVGPELAAPGGGLPGAEGLPPGALPGGAPELPFDPASLTALLSPGLLVAFVAFFLGGYLLFAGLFAAVGAAVEQESDAQSLQLPVTIPVIIPVLFLPFVLERPEAPLSVALSLVPFASPVLMVVRMAVSAVPWWQVALAFGLLVGTFLLVIAAAARIYRVGILMYGKKATLRDLWRWARTS